MSEELAEIIREEIRQKGPIPFSRWMELCLYHPQYGYYMKPGRKTGYGRDADFVTPPTLHPFMAKALARELRDLWVERGSPGTWNVVEFGGGQGDLALGVLATLDQESPTLAKVIRWHHVELNLGHGLEGSSDPRIRKATRDSLPAAADAVVACEFLDALPVDVLEFRGWSNLTGPWVRRAVTSTGTRFAYMEIPKKDWTPFYLRHEKDPFHASRAMNWRWPIEPGTTVLDWSSVFEWFFLMDECWMFLERGPSVLVLDYAAASPCGEPRAFRAHRPAEVLDDPGSCDITASLDFSVVADAAMIGGVGRSWGETRLESMEQFLIRHGILDELNRIDRNSVEGASSYLRLRQLLLPTGMGSAFKVQRLDRLS